MGKAERVVENEVIRLATVFGGFARKYTCPGRRGVPDQIIFLPKLIFFIETKTSIGVLSGPQKREIARMQDLDIPTFVCSSIEEVQETFEKMTKWEVSYVPSSSNVV